MKNESRTEQIAAAQEACESLHTAADLAFSTSNWGDDNGCKRLLVEVRERAQAIRPLLLAASVLHDSAPHAFVIGEARNVCRKCGRLKEDH